MIKRLRSIFQNPFVKRWFWSYLLFGFICLIGFTLFQHYSYIRERNGAEQFIADQLGLLDLDPDSTKDNALFHYYTSGKIDEATAKAGRTKLIDLGLTANYPLITKNYHVDLLTGWSLISLLWLGGLIFFTLALTKFYQQLNDLQLYIQQSAKGTQTYDMLAISEGALSEIKDQLYSFTEDLSAEKELATDAKKELANGIADISHQLKTPLTSLYILTDLLDGPLTLQQQEEISKQFIPQLDRIQSLITSLLTLTKFDAGTLKLQSKPIQLTELIQDCLTHLDVLIQHKRLIIHLDLAEDLVIVGDYKYLKEASLNLIKNAVQYSPIAGTIQIQTTTNPLFTSLIIQDEGTGIAPTDLPYLFKRFYKGSNALSDSVGIGLAMAHTIIEKHHGTIEVQNNKIQGAKFEVKLYKGII